MILICSACAFIVGLNFDNPDYQNYELAFNDAYGRFTGLNIFNVLDIGTKFIVLIGNEVGFDNYSEFRLAYAILLYIILGITISKNCRYGAFYFALYIISYIFLDEIQFRNFSSFVVILPFLIYYVNNQTTKGVIIFLLGDLLAFTLHFSAIFYLIFCFTILRSKIIKFIFIIVAVISIGLIERTESDIAMLDHTSNYEAPSAIGGLFVCILLVGNYVFINWIKKNYLSTKVYDTYPKLYKNFELLIQINLLLLILCPVVFINSNVIRIWRFTSLFNLIYILNLAYSYKGGKNNSKLTLYSLIYSGFIGIWFNNTTGVYESIWNNPLFFDH